MKSILWCGLGSVMAIACSSATETITPAKEKVVLAPELGTGDKSAASINLVPVATASEKLSQPTDLAWNPLAADELWVTNRGDNSFVVFDGATTSSMTVERLREPAMQHFLDKPMALAFGAKETTFGSEGTFATCGESRNEHGSSPTKPNDFMGPVLWTSDRSITGKKDPQGLGSHIDMLHSSPLCVGIAHESANVYWAFGGQSGGIQRYDFAQDHNVGQDDHANGEITWYATGKLSRAEGVPGQVVFRAEDKMLYIADTGNSRIVKLDTTSGMESKNAPAKEQLVKSKYIDDAVLEDVVVGGDGVLVRPAGLRIKGDLLYVSDNANGRVSAFNFKGERVNYVDTGLPEGALGGLAFGPDNRLYVTDMIDNRILRIEPKTESAK